MASFSGTHTQQASVAHTRDCDADESVVHTGEELIADLLDAIATPAGHAPPPDRRLALDLATSTLRGEAAREGEGPLGAATDLIEAVVDRAHDLPEGALERALDGGRSEHEAFDLIVAAAVGAGLARRDIALKAISDWEAEVALDGDIL